jgi:hypothetical protein
MHCHGCRLGVMVLALKNLESDITLEAMNLRMMFAAYFLRTKSCYRLFQRKIHHDHRPITLQPLRIAV